MSAIAVRDFIVRNVSPYVGDETFLVGSSRRTNAVWEKLQPYFQEEQKKGVPAVDAKTPSTLLGTKLDVSIAITRRFAHLHLQSKIAPPGARPTQWNGKLAN